MKKVILLLSLSFYLAVFAIESQAQSNWEAGIRFGEGFNNGFSADVTIPFKAPRIHAAAYFSGGPQGTDFGVGGYFDWLFALDGGPSGLKFYPGVGPEIYFGTNFDFAVAGDFGVEYSFDFPLTIGFDWRPRIVVTNNHGYQGGNWGLLARFRFGEGVSFHKTQ